MITKKIIESQVVKKFATTISRIKNRDTYINEIAKADTFAKLMAIFVEVMEEAIRENIDAPTPNDILEIQELVSLEGSVGTKLWLLTLVFDSMRKN